MRSYQLDAPLALVFPGQGSQKVGMLGDMLEAYPIVRHTLDEADGALGFSLSKLILEGPEEELGAHGEHPAGDARGRCCDPACAHRCNRS